MQKRRKFPEKILKSRKKKDKSQFEKVKLLNLYAILYILLILVLLLLLLFVFCHFPAISHFVPCDMGPEKAGSSLGVIHCPFIDNTTKKIFFKFRDMACHGLLKI